MSQAFISRRGAGGAQQSFQVQLYSSPLLLPSVAKENTLAVISDSPMTQYIISPAEPATRIDGTALSGGEVWITTNVSSIVYFNAIKENGLYVYVSGSRQYIDGVWLAKPLYLYQNAAWQEVLADVYLFNYGDIGISGGFTGLGENISGNFGVGNSLWLNCKQYVQYGYKSNNRIDVTGFKTLKVYGNGCNYDGADRYFRVGLGSSLNGLVAYMQVDSATATYTLDITAITGYHNLVVSYWWYGVRGASVSNINSIQLCT